MNLKFGLATLLISSFLASIVQFNFGKTEITLEKLDTGNGQYIYYDLYNCLLYTSDAADDC